MRLTEIIAPRDQTEEVVLENMVRLASKMLGIWSRHTTDGDPEEDNQADLTDLRRCRLLLAPT